MTKLNYLLTVSLIFVLVSCSEQSSEVIETANAIQPTQTVEGVQQGLELPLNTPISEVPVKEKPMQAVAEPVAGKSVRELVWDDLMPQDFRIEEILSKMNTGEIADDDPRVDEVMAKIKELYSKAPVVEELNNQKIKLPGFIIPLERNKEVANDYLLVPYYGACIHVPPPPANQTVFVTGKESKFKLYDTVWVTGTIKVERTDNDLGDSGYSIIASEIEPYE